MSKLEGIKLKKIQSLIIFGLVIVNIFLFYMIMSKAYFRIDLTEGKKYSISKPTVELLKKLDNKLVINYYYEKRCKAVPEISQVVTYINDMLQEYENNSNNMVDYKVNELSFDNPNDKQKIDELEQQGISTVAMSQNEGAESKRTLGFSGITLSYKGQSGVIGVVFNDTKFEYTVDVEINKLIEATKEKGKGKIGILISSESRTIEKDYSYLYRYITKEYSNAEVIYNPSAISEDISTIVLVGGDLLTEGDLYKLDQFLVSGGKLICAVNGVKLNYNSQGGGPQATASNNKFIDLLSSYGLTINKDLVGDNVSYNPVMQSGTFGVEKSRYPLWIKIVSENINKKNPIVGDFNSVNMFWASSINIADSVKDKTTVLFSTTKNSWNMKDEFKVDLESYKYPLQEGKEQFNLAVSFEGKITSYYKDKEVPKNEGEAAALQQTINEGNTSLVVFSNEDFLSKDFINREDELLIILNALDYLTKDGTLIEIRNKGKFTRPLNKVYNATTYNAYKNIIIGFTTYILPILLIIFAVILNLSRKKKYRLLEEKYSNPEVKKGGE